MGIKSDAQQIYNAIDSLWTDATVDIVHGTNEPYSPTENKSYIRVRLLAGTTAQAGTGSTQKMHRSRRLIDCMIYTPKQRGDLTAKGYADKLVEIYRKNCPFLYRGHNTKELGVEGSFYRYNITFEYQTDEYE